MYPNKLTTNPIFSYDFFNLIFFREIPCSTCYKFVFSQQNCRMSSCKNKNSSNINIKKYTKCKTNIQTQVQASN